MANIYYLPDDREIEIDEEETILDVSIRAQIPHAHACGGNARCSTCRVLVLEGIEHCGMRNDKEQLIADKLNFNPEIRLACQTRVRGKVRVRRLVIDDRDEEIAAHLLREKTPCSVGEEKKIAILFADIRGFTPFAESLFPYDVIHILNRYFHHMGEVINRNGGTINNYMGDGLLALFGVDDEEKCTFRAVNAGLEMIEELSEINPYFEEFYNKRLRIGIGVHYGEAVLGTVGSSEMKRMTAIGDSVNFASRVEAANKELGTSLLISEDTYNQVSDEVLVSDRPASIKVKGKSGEYRLFEVVGIK